MCSNDSLEVLLSGGTLFVDGEKLGRTRKTKNLELKAGRHLVELRVPGVTKRMRKRVTVESGDIARVVFDVRKHRQQADGEDGGSARDAFDSGRSPDGSGSSSSDP